MKKNLWKLEKENWKKFCQKPLGAVSPFVNDTYEIFGYRRVLSPNVIFHNIEISFLNFFSNEKNTSKNFFKIFDKII